MAIYGFWASPWHSKTEYQFEYHFITRFNLLISFFMTIHQFISVYLADEIIPSALIMNDEIVIYNWVSLISFILMASYLIHTFDMMDYYNNEYQYDLDRIIALCTLKVLFYALVFIISFVHTPSSSIIINYLILASLIW